MRWVRDQLSFEVVDDDTDDPVVTIEITTPAGVIKIMAEAEEHGPSLVLRGVHVQADALHSVGVVNLRQIARIVLERLDYDEIIVEGAARTTGASPGRKPASLRFRR